MAMESSALEIIEGLYKMIAEAWGVPLGNEKCIIEREKVLGMLDELKACLPVEIAEARRLVNSRTEYMNSARKEAEAMRAQAEEQVRAMIDKQTIMQQARERSEEMLSSAEKRSRELRRVASEYVDDALRRTEEAMTEALSNVRATRARFVTVTGSAVPAEASAVEEKTEAPAPEEKKDTPDYVEIIPDVEEF